MDGNVINVKGYNLQAIWRVNVKGSVNVTAKGSVRVTERVSVKGTVHVKVCVKRTVNKGQC